MTTSIETKMWKAMAKSPIVMIGLNKNADHSEPMHIQLDENADNCFWAYTKTNNRIADGGKAMAQFMSPDHRIFACISGKLVHEDEQKIVDKYWSNKVEAWYEQGKRDPKLKMMRFELDTMEIWTQDPSLSGLIKLSTGAMVAPDEMGEHEQVNV